MKKLATGGFMKKIFIVVMLILAVTAFAYADTKTEVALKVQFLQEKARRLQLEHVLVLQYLEKAQGELRAIVKAEKEAEKAEDNKKE